MTGALARAAARKRQARASDGGSGIVGSIEWRDGRVSGDGSDDSPASGARSEVKPG